MFAEYPRVLSRLLDAGNTRPPLTLRVNRGAYARRLFDAAVLAQGIQPRAIGADGVVLDEPAAVSALPGYADGWFSVQDAAAQLAAPLLDAQDGMRVLDACAAPGGKTTHLAELAALDLIALDVDAARLARVRENLARLGLAARLIVADAGDPIVVGRRSRSIAYWPTFPAPRRESCAAIPTSSGCVAKATSRASLRSSGACSMRCGHAEARW